MWWMWIVGPILVLIIYVLTGARDKRSEAEVERWRRSMGPKSVARKERPGYRDGKELTVPGPGARKVTSLSGPLYRMVQTAGGGDPIARIELVPKLAYLAAMEANAMSGSDHQTVVARLEEPAPSFTVRPLPITEGDRFVNNGIEFKKDPDFRALFLVEADTSPAVMSTEEVKKIRGWLSRPLRDALRELPDVWLRVDGKTMAATLYGPADADKLQQLVTLADVIFAEHGADGGPSLFGDEEEAEEEDEADRAPPPPPPPAAKKGKAAKASGKAASTKR
jgi:hypothetical protein